MVAETVPVTYFVSVDICQSRLQGLQSCELQSQSGIQLRNRDKMFYERLIFTLREVGDICLVELAPNFDCLTQQGNELVEETQHFVVPGVEVLHNTTGSRSLKTPVLQSVIARELCTLVSPLHGTRTFHCKPPLGPW